MALAEIVGNHKGLWVSIMAENDTAEERTEEPTAKRLEKARSEGRVARSQELSVAAMLIGTAIFSILWVAISSKKLRSYSRLALSLIDG